MLLFGSIMMHIMTFGRKNVNHRSLYTMIARGKGYYSRINLQHAIGEYTLSKGHSPFAKRAIAKGVFAYDNY